ALLGRYVFEFTLLSNRQFLVDFDKSQLLCRKLGSVTFKRNKLSTVLFKGGHQLSFPPNQVCQQQVAIQKLLQQKGVFERIFGYFSQFSLSVILDSKSINGNVRDLAFILRLYNRLPPLDSLVAVSNAILVFTINHDCSGAVIVVL